VKNKSLRPIANQINDKEPNKKKKEIEGPKRKNFGDKKNKKEKYGLNKKIFFLIGLSETLILFRFLLIALVRLEENSFQTRSSSRFGFRVLTGLSGSIFFKLKRHRFSIKKKKQKSTGRNRVFDQVTPGFFFPYFFSIRPGSNPGSTRRVEPGFKTMVRSQTTNKKL
jgi:hypothetical protein